MRQYTYINTYKMSYTLRTISEKNIPHNQKLGENYSPISREKNYEEFCETFKTVFGKKHVADSDEKSDEISRNCYGFVIGSGGTIILPIYKNRWNYIMSETGETFENLTFK